MKAPGVGDAAAADAGISASGARGSRIASTINRIFWLNAGVAEPGPGPNEIQNDEGTCLDDKNGGTANNNPVWFYPCNYTAAQQWDFIVDKGQQLALHDIKHKVNSVTLEGLNQNCTPVQRTVNFPNPYLDISGWYWTTWCGFPGDGTGVWVYMYAGLDGSGTYLGATLLDIPDWQTNTTWYTCQIDGGSNSYPGVNTV
jgi:hypothetical protein